MTRLLVAALAATLMLQGWGAVSSRLLPWPDVYGRLPLPMPDAIARSQWEPNRFARDEGTLRLPPAGSTFAPPASVDDSLVAVSGNAWPIYAFGRRDSVLSTDADLAYLILNVALGAIAALAAALVLRDSRAIGNRLSLALLAVLFIMLLTDVTHAMWMRWPIGYSAVLLTDHLVATILAGGSALVVLALWRPAAPLAAAK